METKQIDIEDFSLRVADIIKTQNYLRSVDENSRDFVPTIDRHFKMTPFFEGKMARFANLLNRQLGLSGDGFLKRLVKNEEMPEWEKLSAKGMTIIVGERGTGKNKLVDYYSAISNRPLFRYACSSEKEERDLTYDIEIQGGEIVRIPTRILTAITTPNAVLELDEINLLRPGVSKFFNSLLDGDRALYLNDQVIKVAQGVLIVGLMNPASYAGVQDLPETIDDRSTVMRMGYAPFKYMDKNGKECFTCDEALIIKEHIPQVKDIPDKEFVDYWSYIINRDISKRVQISETLAYVFRDMRKIIAIVNKTRDILREYKTGLSKKRLERDVSIRGLIEITRFYVENSLWDRSSDLKKMDGYEDGWGPAQYAAAMTYLPHVETYGKGSEDAKIFRDILKQEV